MNNKSNILYVFLILGAISVVMFMLYLFIGTYNNVPIASLLPFASRKQSATLRDGIPSPSPKPANKNLPSVQRIVSSTGLVVYIVQGKFVTAPTYNSIGMLQGDFVIDRDPLSHKIKVIMTSATGKMNVSKSEGSFDGKTLVGTEDGDNIRQSITVNAPVQLRVYSTGSVPSASDKLEQKVLDGIIQGDWSIPDNYILSPPSIGFIE